MPYRRAEFSFVCSLEDVITFVKSQPYRYYNKEDLLFVIWILYHREEAQKELEALRNAQSADIKKSFAEIRSGKVKPPKITRQGEHNFSIPMVMEFPLDEESKRMSRRRHQYNQAYKTSAFLEVSVEFSKRQGVTESMWIQAVEKVFG